MSSVETASVSEALAAYNVGRFMDGLKREVEAPLCLQRNGDVVDWRNKGKGLGRHNALRRWLLDDPGLTEGHIPNAQGLLAEKLIKDVLSQVLPGTDIRLAPYDLANPRNHGGRAGDLLLGRYVTGESGLLSDVIEPLAQIDVTISKRRHDEVAPKMRRNRNQELGVVVIVLPLVEMWYRLSDGRLCDVREYLEEVKSQIRAGRYSRGSESFHLSPEYASGLISVLQQKVSTVLEHLLPREAEMLRKLSDVQEILRRTEYLNVLQ